MKLWCTLLALLTLTGCGESSHDDTAAPAAPSPAEDETAGGGDTGGEEATPWWDEVADNDGDGFSSDEDCDDSDAATHPEGQESCDGVDNDCDGVVDEDVVEDEPDADLGTLSPKSEVFASQYLFPEADEDRYRFYIEDTYLDYFDIEVWLYQIPEDADYAIELYWIEDVDGVDQGLVAAADTVQRGGVEFLNYSGKTLLDDTGWYEIVVIAAEGASCAAPYQLQILTGSW